MDLAVGTSVVSLGHHFKLARLLRNSQLESEIANHYVAFDEDRQWDWLLRDQQSDYWAEAAGILPRPILRAAVRGTEPTISPCGSDDLAGCPLAFALTEHVDRHGREPRVGSPGTD